MKSIKKYQTTIIWLVVAVIAFAGGDYYGRSYGMQTGMGGVGGFASSTRQFGGGRGRNGGGFSAGQITAIDPQSITIQLTNGNSEVVFYSSSTSVIKPMPAAVADLTPGMQVMIGGMQNSDGSLTAQSIQIRTGNIPGFGGSRTPGQ